MEKDTDAPEHMIEQIFDLGLNYGWESAIWCDEHGIGYPERPSLQKFYDEYNAMQARIAELDAALDVAAKALAALIGKEEGE